MNPSFVFTADRGAQGTARSPVIDLQTILMSHHYNTKPSAAIADPVSQSRSTAVVLEKPKRVRR